MKVSEISVEEYRDFVSRQKMDNFLQSPEMYSRYQKIGKEAYLFGGFEGKKLVVAGLVVKMREKLGKKVYNMPRGPIWDDKASGAEIALNGFLEAVERILRAKGGMILQISPNVWRKRAEAEEMKELSDSLVKAGFKNLGEYEQVKWAYILELKGKTAAEILKSFRQTCRHSIRYATERYNLKVRELADDEIGVLKEITEKTGERRGFRDPELKYYQDMKAAFSDKVKFLIAEWDGTGAVEAEKAEVKAELSKRGGRIPIAAAMFLTYGGETIYLFSGSDNKYKRYTGPHLIQWEMIQRALADKVPIYNFYGTHPIELGSEKGVYGFKKGFRGEFIEYVGTFAKPLNLLGRLYLVRIKYQEFRELS